MKSPLRTVTFSVILLLGTVLSGCGQPHNSAGVPIADAAPAAQPYTQAGDLKIYHATFNSSFLHPQVADSYNIVRGEGKGIVSLSVVADDRPSGIAAEIRGTATNLLGQPQQLQFFAVHEGDALYYLAPFNFTHEDQLSFALTVKADTQQPAQTINFRRTMYRDR